MKGCESYIFDEIEYKNLNAEMNQFYDKCKDVDDVKPVTIEEGQVKLFVCCAKSFVCCADSVICTGLGVKYARYALI